MEIESITPAEFEELGRVKLNRFLSTDLRQMDIPPTKKWDYVSPDMSIVGDAKLYRYAGQASAEKSTISEHVWLLEKLPATCREKFLFFGGNLGTVMEWLRRWRSLLPQNVRFLYLREEDGEIGVLYAQEPKFSQVWEQLLDHQGRWKKLGATRF